MNIFDITKENYTDIPQFEGQKCKQFFDSFIIIPTGEIHDSGFGCMAVIACLKENAVYRFTGYSDVIHIDGIGGYGEWNEKVPNSVPPKGWCVDCTPNGFVRLFCRGKMKPDIFGCSDYSLYGVIKT